MLKRVIGIMATLVFLAGVLYAFGGEAKTFTDLPKSHWAYKSVTAMSETGIISGYPDGSFRPGDYVTYGEFIKMAATAGEIMGVIKEGKPGDHWAKPYYDAALANFYVNEWDIPIRLLKEPIPRRHMALVASGAMGFLVKVEDYGNYEEILGRISDIGSGHENELDIVKAFATGVLSGYPDGTFRPDEALTRAEAASVIDRLNAQLAIVKSKIPKWEPKEELLEEEGLVRVKEYLDGIHKGAFEFTIREYGKDQVVQNSAILEEVNKVVPTQGEAILNAFKAFSQKPTKNAFRKEYFGEYPVFIDRIYDTFSIMIFPIGYEDDIGWGIKPGQVEEYTFDK